MKCIYWDFELNEWSRNGCNLLITESNNEMTVCECNHLTNFAAVVDKKWIDDLIDRNITDINDVIKALEDIATNTESDDSFNTFNDLRIIVDFLMKLQKFIDSEEIELSLTLALNITNVFMKAYNNLINQNNAWNNTQIEEKTGIASQILLYIQYTAFSLSRFLDKDNNLLRIENENIVTNIYFTDYSADILFAAKSSSILIPKGIKTDELNSNSGVGSLISGLDNYLMSKINKSHAINTDIIAFSATNSNKTLQLTDNNKIIVRYRIFD